MSDGKKYFSGNSLEQAVLQAARHFKIEAGELAYRKIERRHGFLKTRRRAVIEVDVSNPRRPAGTEPEKPAEEPIEESTSVPVGGAPMRVESERRARPAAPPKTQATAAKAPRGGGVGEVRSGPPTSADHAGLTELPDKPARQVRQAEGRIADAAREALRRLLALGNLSVEASIFEGEEGLEVEIRGDDEDAFLEDRGRLLLAMQHLLPRLIRGLIGETVPCRVDCDNFQEIRAEQLRVLAQRVATEVRDRRRPRTLEPMSPDERRIIHMTLADDSAVETESQGTGLFKRVMVMPARQRPRGFDPYTR